jgi:hypothetical protein
VINVVAAPNVDANQNIASSARPRDALVNSLPMNSSRRKMGSDRISVFSEITPVAVRPSTHDRQFGRQKLISMII